MTPAKDELPELPEDALPELPDLPELPELPDLPEETHKAKVLPEETAEKISVLPDMNDIPELPEEKAETVPDPKEPAPVTPPAPSKPTQPEPAPARPEEPAPTPAQPEPAPVAPPTPPKPDSTPTAAAPAAAAAAMAMPDPGTKRELDGPPQHLQKAALIAIVGGLLPWQSWGYGGPMTWAVGKLVVLLGAFLLWKSVDLRSGLKVPGFIAALGKIELVKKKELDPKAAARKAARQTGPAKLEVPFPTVLHVVGLLLLVAGCFTPLFDGAFNALNADIQGAQRFKSLAEIGMLAWAAGTWIHIYAYERWGSFNPIYPFIFIGLLVAGLQRTIEAVTDERGMQFMGVLGGLAVGIAGGMAAYTIVESMMQAKREGDAKKAAEIERRKAARARKGN